MFCDDTKGRIKINHYGTILKREATDTSIKTITQLVIMIIAWREAWIVSKKTGVYLRI